MKNLVGNGISALKNLVGNVGMFISASKSKAIPSQLSRNTSRYQVGNAIPDEKVDRVINIIKDMEDSMTTNIAFHSDDPNIGLALTKNLEYFKMYTSDTGLFVTLAFKHKEL